jgi:hypothetical protein
MYFYRNGSFVSVGILFTNFAMTQSLEKMNTGIGFDNQKTHQKENGGPLNIRKPQVV